MGGNNQCPQPPESCAVCNQNINWDEVKINTWSVDTGC